MRKVINCITDNNPIINKKLREVSVEEGLSIATELFQILNKRGDGIGLASNQVGIDAQVAVVNVREPIILINPKIIDQWEEVPYYEGCLSFPGQAIRTQRYRHIIVKSADVDCQYYFSGAGSPKGAKGSWETSAKHDQDQRLLEAICVQHEIDHLMGSTIHDREKNLEPVKSEKKIGRNQLVTIKKGDAVKVLKYKKARNLLNQGWVME
mgnify:FL=1